MIKIYRDKENWWRGHDGVLLFLEAHKCLVCVSLRADGLNEARRIWQRPLMAEHVKEKKCLDYFQSGNIAVSGCTTTLMWSHGKGVVGVRLQAERGVMGFLLPSPGSLSVYILYICTCMHAHMHARKTVSADKGRDARAAGRETRT